MTTVRVGKCRHGDREAKSWVEDGLLGYLLHSKYDVLAWYLARR